MVSFVLPARRTLAALILVMAAPLTGCGAGTAIRPTQAASTADDSAGGGQPGGQPGGPPGGTVQGGNRIVLLDPGHNGGNANAPTEINKPVPDGRKGTKACNTTGTSTDDGYPEHRFTWSVARQVRELLEANGVTVVMTRNDDTGVGPCVDVRGKMAEQVNADLSVSIHADGGPSAGHGFHVAYSSPPLSQSQGEPSVSLATTMRDAMRGAGLSPSTYLGEAGLAPRSDLAGLNLARRPAVLVECGNMRNADEKVMLSHGPGRGRIATAIANGILSWLAKH